MKTAELRSVKKNHLTERNIKFLKDLRIEEEISESYTKSDIDFLRRVHKHGHSFIRTLKKTNPEHLTEIQHLADLYDDLLTYFGVYHLPHYRSKKQDVDPHTKSSFADKDIKYLENLKIGNEASPRYTKSDIDFLRRAHNNENRFILFIQKISPKYLAAAEQLTKLYYDLLAMFAYYHLTKNVDKNRKIDPHGKTATANMKERWKMKNRVIKRRAPKRTEGQLPFKDLDPSNEKNRTRQQMKVSLPPNIIKAANKFVENEDFSRNEWIKDLIEKEISVQAPYLLQDNMTLENTP